MKGDSSFESDIAKKIFSRASDVSGIPVKQLTDKNAMKYGYRWHLLGAIETAIEELANQVMQLQQHNQELERRLWEKENGHYNK